MAALRGAGDTRFPLIATVLGLLVMRCGLAAIAVYLELAVFWVYAALVGDYVLKGALLIWRFRKVSGRKLFPTKIMARTQMATCFFVGWRGSHWRRCRYDNPPTVLLGK